MKNIIKCMWVLIVGFIVGCGDAGTTTTEGIGGSFSVGGNSNNTGGSTIILDTVIINSSGGKVNNSTAVTIVEGGAFGSVGGATSCTPRTCNEAASVMINNSGAHNGLGDLVNWSYVSVTACGEVSDGCGGILNCSSPSCTGCGTVNTNYSLFPAIGIAGICPSTMCYNYSVYDSTLCVGVNAGKLLWVCNPGDAVGPRTKVGCSSIANKDPNDTLTLFCCSK